MRLLWIALNILMLLAFIFSVIVQYNDPDPVRWMAIYGAAALACILELRRRTQWPLPGGLALIALSWAASIAPNVHGVRLPDLWAEFEMKNEMVEQAREMGGLLIVAAWMLVLAIAALRRSRHRPPGATLYCLLLGVVVPFSASCSNSSAPLVCTEIGCNDGLSVEVTGARTSDLMIDLVATGQPTQSFQCRVADAVCRSFVANYTPAQVVVRLRTATGFIDRAVTPQYRNTQPNGPDCPPTCRQATIQVSA